MKSKILNKVNHINPVYQNLLVGSLLGIIMGINLRLIYKIVGGIDWIWMLFFLIGPAIGFFSGKERLRAERLKQEKINMKYKFNEIEKSLKKSANKYRIVIENASDAIYLTTETGQFILFNQATCLLSGYDSKELKKMKLSNLQLEEETKRTQNDAWLDNGICRQEDHWKVKGGEILTLEVNSKWIKLGSHQLILHVARDIMRRKQAYIDDKTRSFTLLHKNHIIQSAMMNEKFLKRIGNTMSSMVGVMNKTLQIHPEFKEECSKIRSEWEETKHLIQSLVAKSHRDQNTIPSFWDVSKIINQELNVLKLMVKSDTLTIRAQYDDDLPKIQGEGSHFSFVFGTVFKAILKSIYSIEQKEILISTRGTSEEVHIEIRVPGSKSFIEHLVDTIDPSIKNVGSIKWEDGYKMVQEIFKMTGVVLETGKYQEGILIKVMISTLSLHTAEDNKELLTRNDKKIVVL